MCICYSHIDVLKHKRKHKKITTYYLGYSLPCWQRHISFNDRLGMTQGEPGDKRQSWKFGMFEIHTMPQYLLLNLSSNIRIVQIQSITSDIWVLLRTDRFCIVVDDADIIFTFQSCHIEVLFQPNNRINWYLSNICNRY